MRLSIVPITFLLAAAAALAQSPSPSLTVSSVPGLAPAGTMVTVTVSLVSGSGPAAIQWDMTGLPAAATITTPVAGKTASCTATATRCIVSGLNATAIPDGVVASIQYVQPAAPPTVALAATLAATPAGSAETITGEPAASHCDINGDGKIDATDISLILTQALSSTTGTPTVLDVVRVIIAAFGGACLR